MHQVYVLADDEIGAALKSGGKCLDCGAHGGHRFNRLSDAVSLEKEQYFGVEWNLFITVIAYQLVQVIRRRLAGEGMNMSWATVRSILAGQQRVTASFRRKDGRYLHVRKATQAEGPQREIYRALGIDEAPGWVRKTVV